MRRVSPSNREGYHTCERELGISLVPSASISVYADRPARSARCNTLSLYRPRGKPSRKEGSMRRRRAPFLLSCKPPPWLTHY